jgi:hypothetical protein
VHVDVKERRRAASLFSFPGIDGVFERNLGLREQPIVWRGQLRAADDAALNALEAAMESEIANGQEKTMVDPWGRSYASCVVKAFRRAGSRRRDHPPGLKRGSDNGHDADTIRAGGTPVGGRRNRVRLRPV